MAKKQELMRQNETEKAIACTGFEDEVDSGFEDLDAGCFAIPYVYILQKNSPQCDEDSGSKLTDARPGMLFNNVTQELFDGDAGIEVTPVKVERAYVEWVDRDQGGGYRGKHRCDEEIVIAAQGHRDEKGRLLLENGHYLEETIYVYALLRNLQQLWVPVVIPFRSTQLRKARSWNSTMLNYPMQRRDGTWGSAPMHSRVYRLTTRPEVKDKGTFRGWCIETLRKLEPQNSAEDRDIVLAARAFKKQISDGSARIMQVEDASVNETDSEPLSF